MIAAMTLAGGELFAGYTVERLLGSGGMGEVYLARHPRLPRQEALKILRIDISNDDSFRQRFIREADSIASLEHPNIVTVHDRGDTDGRLWIATQYVDGSDAAQQLRDRYPVGMPVDEVAGITTAVAEALDYAHSRGLLHRDVKPANILLAHPDHDGRRRIYLADFGIARPLDDPAGLTATNFTLGTVAYAAPEQLMGKAIDGRADQYALAATAYHLLTGAPVYADSNPVAVISQHLTEPAPPPSSVRPQLAAFDGAFERALAKNPADRFPRCQDFARAVAAAAAGSGSGYPASALTQAAPIVQANTIAGQANPPASRVAGGRRGLKGLVIAAAAVGSTVAVSMWHQPWSANQGNSSSPTSSTLPATSSPAAPPPVAQPSTAAPSSPSAEVTPPASGIKPVSVRPVISAFVADPSQCPSPMSAPPNAPVTVCDLANTAIYELAPEAMRVQVTDVDSFRNPVTGAELVQMSMTAASASQFGRFTAGLVGEQIAFVRNGMVVWGPKITAPIDGQVLQLSGELTEQQAQQIARILRDGN